MGVDDGGAGGDVVVVADVPLRHVDEMMIAEAARRIGHAGEAEIGAVGEHRRQQRRFVGGGIAGAQMHEPFGESGPSVDIAQNLGDPHPRQHSVQPQRQIARRLGNGGRGAGDEQFAVLDLDPVEFAARGAVGHESQALAQRGRAGGDVTTGIGLAVDPHVPRGFGGQQIVLERPIIAAASDPDVAASQPLAQRGEHRRFVEPPVRRAVREDQLAPLRRQERRGRPFGQRAGAVAIHRPEKIDGGQHGIVRRVRPEVERGEEARAEPAQHRISLGRRDQDVLIRHVGDGPDDGQHAIELLHADLAFDHGDAVLSGFLGVPERGDGAAEQDQCPGDIAPRGLETPLVAVPRPAEQGAHVFLEHGERRVGQPGLEACRLDNEDRRSPRGFEIGDVRDGHDRPFVDQPGEASCVNASGARGSIPNPRAYSRRSSSATMLEGAGDSE